MRYTITNKLALSAALQDIQRTFAKSPYLEIDVRTEKRKLTQSALFWVWCRQVAKEEDQGRTEADVAADVKLEKGFEIRRASDGAFDEFLRKTVDKLKYAGRWDMAHEMAKFTDCTSKMSKTQMSDLLEWMQAHYAANAGIILESVHE